MLKEQGPAGLRLVGSGQNNFVRKGELAHLGKAGGHADELGVVGRQVGLGEQLAVGVGEGAGDDPKPLNIAGEGVVV